MGCWTFFPMILMNFFKESINHYKKSMILKRYIFAPPFFSRRIIYIIWIFQGRNYLVCDYNRDGDSHRSPWSNHYFPPLEDGFVPSEKLRAMEIEFNELFDAYRELYFEGGTSSVYLWDLEQGFAGCFLIKKSKDIVMLSCDFISTKLLQQTLVMATATWRMDHGIPFMSSKLLKMIASHGHINWQQR